MTRKATTSSPPAEEVSAPPGGLLLAVLRIPTGRHRNMHALHQAVLAATADTAGTSVERALWAAPTPGLLLVQTPTRLDPAVIGGAEVERTVDVGAALDRLGAGARVRFGLVANPCRAERVTASGIGRARRVPLPNADRPDWLRRKVADALVVEELVDRPLRPVAADRAEGRAALARHLYTGTATVTDPAALAGLVRAGVGPGKAYGCGLLTIREGR